MTPLEKLKQCFNELNIIYVITKEEGYTNLWLVGDSKDTPNYNNDQLFEFDPNGELASY